MTGLKKMKNNRRLYVLVDETLPPIYGAVQGGHCVAQYMLDNKNNKEAWNNEYLIYLSADVNLWKQILVMRKKKFSEFHEPDLDNKLTAIALVDSGRMFKRLPLLRAK
jgi:hypothetical protein